MPSDSKKAEDVTSVSAWAPAIVDIKSLPSFAEIVAEQGRDGLSFSQLEMLLEGVDEQEDFTVDDLLAAL